MNRRTRPTTPMEVALARVGAHRRRGVLVRQVEFDLVLFDHPDLLDLDVYAATWYPVS